MNRLTGFFGGGKKSTNEDGMGPEKTDLAVGGENFGGGDFGGGGMSAPRVGGAPPGQAATQAELQRAVVAEQQRALVQQVIAKLTEVSFDTCLQKKPDSTLSAGERACIHTVVGKYLDTSEFVLGRSTKKAQQSQMLG
jgi:import inner membrane translocase subunit TIM8